jgi:hypothetical protein
LRGISEHFLSIVDADDLETLERAMTGIARQAGPGRGEPDVCVPDIAEAPGSTAGR